MDIHTHARARTNTTTKHKTLSQLRKSMQLGSLWYGSLVF